MRGEAGRFAPGTPIAAPGLLAALRGVLGAAGYTAERFEEALGLPIADRVPDPVLDARRLAGDDRFATLARLFYADAAVPASVVGAALAPLDAEDLERAGLLRRRGRDLRAEVRIEPHCDLLIASDRLDFASADRVTGVDPSATRTARLTVPLPAGSMLDLGTGGGLQALLGASRCDLVTGTDVNRRALAFATTNATLNEVANVAWRQGSWFAPVADETFDLIVANLPFAISPDASLTFRDSGLPGDALARQIVREAASRLPEGGIAQVLCNWVHGAADAWDVPLRAWVPETGADALFLHTGTVDAVTYAGVWNPRSGRGGREGIERWLHHYEQAGIEAVAGGMVVLRRRDASRNWVAPVDITAGVSGPAGEHVLRLIEAQDFLIREPPEALLAQTFALVDGQVIEQVLTYEGGRYERFPAVVRPSSGLGVEVEVSAEALDLVFACDGRRSLEDAITAVASASGRTPEQVAAAGLDAVRRLYEGGLLARVSVR